MERSKSAFKKKDNKKVENENAKHVIIGDAITK